jgi:hypothetical protein
MFTIFKITIPGISNGSSGVCIPPHLVHAPDLERNRGNYFINEEKIN